MPTRLKIVFMSLSFFFLWACAGPVEQPTLVTEPAVQEPDAVPEEIIIPLEEIIPEPVPETAPSHTPDDLLGLEPKAIQDLLGPVSLKRWEGDAQMMQFTNGQCVMDIYFYETTPGGAFEVSYLSTRTLSGAEVDAASRLTSLLP